MAVKEKPGGMTLTRVDTNTLTRLKVLAGSSPVARYLRNLTLELTSDIPPSMDALAGGYSQVPLHRKLDKLIDMIMELAENVEQIDRNSWAAYEGQRKAGFDLTLVVGKLLKFLDREHPGLEDALLAEAKQDSERLWPDELRKVNPAAPSLKVKPKRKPRSKND